MKNFKKKLDTISSGPHIGFLPNEFYVLTLALENKGHLIKKHLEHFFYVVASKIFLFPPLFGEDSHFDEYFSDGLVQPPTRFLLSVFLVGQPNLSTAPGGATELQVGGETRWFQWFATSGFWWWNLESEPK